MGVGEVGKGGAARGGEGGQRQHASSPQSNDQVRVQIHFLKQKSYRARGGRTPSGCAPVSPGCSLHTWGSESAPWGRSGTSPLGRPSTCPPTDGSATKTKPKVHSRSALGTYFRTLAVSLVSDSTVFGPRWKRRTTKCLLLVFYLN